MAIPFCNFEEQNKAYKDEMMHALSKILDSGQFIQGSWVRELENKLQSWVGAKYCLSCANGTDAVKR